MLNKVTLIGRVGQDPEKKETQIGIITKFSLATSSGKDKTEWHNCVAFNKTADVILQYVKKGDVIAVGGSISYNKYEKDGQTRTSTEILVYDVTLIGGGKKQVPEQQEEKQDILPF